ncbi:MAG: hypothetical protein ACREPA_10435 [Candidatus Dormibacteraceae bacterium]
MVTATPAPPPAAGSHPAGSVFTALAHGYDISVPQCGQRSGGPSLGAFAIVGVNGGKAFTLNPCFADQWRHRAVTRFIYLNSGYSPGNARRVTSACRHRAETRAGGDPSHRLAYALGCSTAEDTLGALRRVGIPAPPIWWVDVENANSWEVQDLALNTASIRGEVDALAATGRPVGVYASFRDWGTITGGWSYPGITADWVAGKTPRAACASPGFSGAPVWLAQEVAPWPVPGWDSDYAC